MASTEGLVPITRAFLASYYDNYHFPPLSDDVSRLSDQLHSFSHEFYANTPLSEGNIYLFRYFMYNIESF